jgi:hypothetical protein
MSLRDPRDANLPVLSLGDIAARELLRRDRDDGGDGVTREALQIAGHTCWLPSMIGRLRAHGDSVGMTACGLYQLGPSSTRASDDGRPAVSSPLGLSSGVPVEDGELRLFGLPAHKHYEAEAA